jgi:hypothetical protein
MCPIIDWKGSTLYKYHVVVDGIELMRLNHQLKQVLLLPSNCSITYVLMVTKK